MYISLELVFYLIFFSLEDVYNIPLHTSKNFFSEN
jgi:hypothetical protein